MMNYNKRNGNKCFYIGGSMVKGVRRVRRMRVGHYETVVVILIVWVCLIL